MPKATELEEALGRALEGRAFRFVASCGSTNDEAAAWAADGAPDLAIVVADEQTAGRGRRDRTWLSQRGTALTCSVILPVPAQPGTAPLIVGVAVARTVLARAGVKVALKWPNDVLSADGRKLAGILCELHAGRVIAGIGINVSAAPAEVGAVSLATLGALRLDRADLAAAILDQLEELQRSPDDALDRWRELSSTLGSKVRIVMADGSILDGVAEALRPSGALQVRGDEGLEREITAGDVTHLRG